jgi:hypothetical protein
VGARARRNERFSDRIELAATVLMAVAAVLTAWAAFQATKWSGVQADGYSQASAARTDSVKFTTVQSEHQGIDVQSFLQWLAAYDQDLREGLVDPTGTYVPEATTHSGFIALRFREEFKPAFEAWMATRPVVNAEATGTPFDLPEYQLEAEVEANRAHDQAEEHASDARAANERGDNYVLLTVLFATALFFGAMSGKLDDVRNSGIALGVAAVIVVVAVVIMATFPVEV